MTPEDRGLVYAASSKEAVLDGTTLQLSELNLISKEAETIEPIVTCPCML